MQQAAREGECAPALGKFILASPLDPVDEVLVVHNRLTERFVRELEPILHRASAKLTPVTVPGGEEEDVWMQDAVELGCVVAEGGDGLTCQPAALLGLRALHDDLRCEPLDARMRAYLHDRGIQCFDVGPPRAGTKWIDWYGNLEVSPPITTAAGSAFPFGRVLTGRQDSLAIHPRVIGFLEEQGLQTPPLVVDTSWLLIGHVDEVVSFVPANDPPGFRVLIPGPGGARCILERLSQEGHGAVPVFQGTGAQSTVDELLDDVALEAENRDISGRITAIRRQLCEGLGVRSDHFVPLPALFREGTALIPNPVNSLICNGYAIVADPRGPRVNGQDMFAAAIGAALEQAGVQVHFLDVWDSFHIRDGEIHCGTNTIRHVRL